MKSVFFNIICLSLVICGSFSCGKAGSGINKTYTNPYGQQCGCDSSYSPVCDTFNKISYDNKCVASCVNAAYTTPGNCICKNNLKVCAKSKYTGLKVTLTECDAIIQYMEFGREQIISYTTCSGI